MESQSRGSRYPAPSRVAHKLASDIAVVSLPHRPRLRAGTGPRDELTIKHHLLDTSSLSGTTAPSSPTVAESPATAASGHSLPVLSHQLFRSKSTQNLRRDVLPQLPYKSLDVDDPPSVEAFRRHHRGIGSIDSMLSSTTCVNTQSECSRPASRVDRVNRYEPDAIPGHLLLQEISKYAYDEDTDDLVLLDSATPTRGTHFVPTTSPAFSPTPIAINADCEGEDGVQEETRVVNEISSWVMRSLWGTEVDECAAPLLIADCTQRYLQELWTAAKDGKLRNAAASPEQGGLSPGSVLNSQGSPIHNGSGKGKRKANGGGEDGDGYGDEDTGRGDGDGNSASVGVQRPAGRPGNSSNFSCPYRKRNPLRFNVRDYYVCATHSFADMSQLKKHIRAHHPPVQRNAGPFSCPRCFQGFPTKNDLDDHLRQPDVCRITFDQSGADPEDGITQKIIVSLEARTLKLKIDNWISLWKLLFPADKTVPDSTFIPVMEVFDFVAESKKFLNKLRELLELQYRYVLDGADQSVDVDRKIQQGLDRSTNSFYNWVETVIQDWEQRFTGTVSLFSQLEALNNQPPPAEEPWAGTSQLLPPSPALTPTVAPTTESSTSSAMPRDDSPESTSQSSVSGVAGARRANPPKRIRRSDAVPKTQLPVPIQKARTPQPQNRTPSSSLRRPSGVPVLATQAPSTLPPSTLPPNPPIQNPRPSYPQHWADYPQVSSPYGPPYTVMASSPGISAPHYPTSTIPPSPFLPSEPTTPADQHQQQQQAHLDGMHPDPAASAAVPDSRHSSTIRASRFLGSTPRSSLTSVWVRDPSNLNANRDSAQTLVEAHPPGPCTNIYCPSCSKTLPEGMNHPGMPHTPVHGSTPMFEGNGMVGMGAGFGMGVVGEEHGGFVSGQGEWASYGGMGIGIEGANGMGTGPGAMFGGAGMQEGF